MSIPYTEREIEQRLRERLPGWTFEGGYLVRTFETGNWQRTLLLANAIGFVGEAAWHHPDLHLSYPRLKVLRTTHDSGGITDRDFELADRIEQVATWQPSGGALAGPDEPWFR